MSDNTINLLQGDCLEQMKQLPDNSVDSIVTDPPYGISFMAKKWDYDVPKVDVWKEAMRVLKHGGHALIACGTRTQHRMVVNIEDAGFEIRDVVSWIYGSGFPKSLNVSKAIDRAAGAEREVVGSKRGPGKPQFLAADNGGINSPDRIASAGFEVSITTPATEEAKQWDGWGTALKPACEFFTLCRKPLSEKTVAANVLKWGTGGINIDGCRVGTDTSRGDRYKGKPPLGGKSSGKYQDMPREEVWDVKAGRFPANLIHDGSQQVLELFPETNKDSTARFFYCPKASKKDRDEGLEGFEEKQAGAMTGKEYREDRPPNHPMRKNTHPTVKPTALMQYLCRLITPTGGVVLDPYMGSGSTGKAAVKEGFSFVGCELDEEYYKIAKARIQR